MKRRFEIAYLAGSGAARLRKTVTAGAGADLAVPLHAADASAITAADPQPTPSTPQFYRQARFLPVSDQPFPFEASTLQIAIVKAAGAGWAALGLDTLLHADAAITTSAPWTADFLQLSARVTWTTLHLAVDGQFTFTGDLKSGDAWIWWLSGPSPAIGTSSTISRSRGSSGSPFRCRRRPSCLRPRRIMILRRFRRT